MNGRELEARITALEDTEAIKRVKARYLFFMDAGHRDPARMQKVVALFADDATFEFPGVGSGQGLTAVADFFTRVFPTMFTFTMHMVHSPLIEVSGEMATGEWYAQVLCTVREGNEAAWSQGKYEDEFVKQGDGWKIKRVVWKSMVDFTHDQGWAKKSITGWVPEAE